MKGGRERRRERRLRQPVPCRLEIEGREHSGVVFDVSRHGLFVQTRAKATLGTPALLRLRIPGNDTPLTLEANVARLNRVPPALAPNWKAGIGLSVPHPSPAYLELVERLGKGRDAAPESRRAEPACASRSFRVRAAQIAGTRTRTLLVRCASQALAGELALTELGEEWKILSVDIAPE